MLLISREGDGGPHFPCQVALCPLRFHEVGAVIGLFFHLLFSHQSVYERKLTSHSSAG